MTVEWTIYQTRDEVYVFNSRSPGKRLGVVMGFGSSFVGRLSNLGIEPGKYIDKTMVTVKVHASGLTASVHSQWLELVDQQERAKRIKAAIEHDNPIQRQFDRIGELPETPFRELDRVQIVDTRGCAHWLKQDQVYEIVFINYAQFGQRTIAGDSMPMYTIRPIGLDGPNTEVHAEQIQMVERGKFWAPNSKPIGTSQKQDPFALLMAKLMGAG